MDEQKIEEQEIATGAEEVSATEEVAEVAEAVEEALADAEAESAQA